MSLPDWYARVGGHPALDFVNTIGWRGTAAQDDALGSVDRVVSWGLEVGVLTAGERDRVLTDPDRPGGLRRLTEARSTFEAILDALAHDRAPDDDDLDDLKNAYARAVKGASLQMNTDGLVWSWSDAPALERVLHPVVVSMMELVGSEDARRVKICGEDSCGWMFLDRSKNGSRRWCSMQICGSRAKMRRHYRNKKERTDDPLLVKRCESCGDTFPIHRDDPVTCPTCGSTDAIEAHEPLL